MGNSQTLDNASAVLFLHYRAKIDIAKGTDLNYQGGEEGKVRIAWDSPFAHLKAGWVMMGGIERERASHTHLIR